MHPKSVCAATATLRLLSKMAAWKAQQEVAGGLTEIFESLHEQSQSLGQKSEGDVEAQAKRLAVAEGTLSFLETNSEESAERERLRDIATQKHREQQVATQQARYKTQDAQVN